MDRIIDISSNDIYLNLYRGFIKLSRNKETLDQIPLGDVLAIVVSGYNIGYSHNILVEISMRAIPLFICADNHHPISALLSIDHHHKQKERLDEQINIREPFKKNLWKKIIKAKIYNQARTLELYNLSFQQLDRLSMRVKSGDIDNNEAVAAKIYWKRLFGNNFIRDTYASGVNSLLNYGYAIIRATISRYVVASGLNPSLAVFHKNKLNSFCLVDDLIEVYRPWVDHKVKQEVDNNNDGDLFLTPTIKSKLVAILTDTVRFNDKNMDLKNSIKEYVYSVVNAYQNKKPQIIFPKFNYTND
jgi:CRISPR-associated protein Cas1